MLHAPEVLFVDVLRHVDDGEFSNAGVAGRQLLLDAWRRLQRSGVLRERGIEGYHREGYLIRVAKSHVREQFRAQEAQYASAALRGCALEACGAREVHPAQFKKCAACRAAVYCCKAHQEQHWPAHKAACKAARKAAAAAAQGGAGPSSGA